MFNIARKAVFVLIIFCLIAGSVFAAESIVIKGSTTVLPIAQAALEAYMKANPVKASKLYLIRQPISPILRAKLRKKKLSWQKRTV
jgi:hypothetical protein